MKFLLKILKLQSKKHWLRQEKLQPKKLKKLQQKKSKFLLKRRHQSKTLSKKLLKLSVQVGAETRTILSGIKKSYKPEDLVGKRVMIVANLAPRKIAGEESQGMIVAAEDDDGNIALMTPMAKMPSGCLIG